MASCRSPPTIAAAALAVSFLCLAGPAHSRVINMHGKVSADESCATASFQDLCYEMLGTGSYDTDMDLARSIFNQAKDKLEAAIKEADRLKPNSGAQEKYIDGCKDDFNKAAGAMGETIKYFSYPQSDFDNWDQFVKYLLQSSKYAYECTASWEDAHIDDKFLLADISSNINKFLFNAYDLGMRALVHT